MPRGYYWEQSYVGHADNPSDEITPVIAFHNGAHNKRIATDPRAPARRLRRLSVARDITLELCDFESSVEDSVISNVRFERCRFVKTRFQHVKFSNCHFNHCHFGDILFRDCVFVESCTFSHNSASAERLRLHTTAVSPKAFISGLAPNLRDLPPDVEADYQVFRFSATKVKLAKLVWSSNEDEANLGFYFDAQAELVRAILDQRVQRDRYTSLDLPATRRSKCSFLIRSLLPRIERRAMLASGWISDWGRSVLRPMGVFLAIVLTFSNAWYWMLTAQGQPASPLSSAGRAINLTLVAGYTVHIGSASPFAEKCLAIINVLVGLWWYSLLIPVLLRRIIR